MWLYDYLKRLFAFSAAYVRIVSGATFDFLHDAAASKSVFGKFYWVSLVICAFAIFYLFSESEQFKSVTSNKEEIARCYPNKTIPFLAFFILAEIASLVLLLGSRLAGAAINGLWPGHKLHFSSKEKPVGAHTAVAVSRRLYRQMWVWFPITLAICVFLSTGNLGDVVIRCKDEGLSGFIWLKAIFWPGFVVSFAIVVLANWLLFRWKWSARSVFILGIIFLFYFLAITVVGPSDSVLINGFRELPKQIPEKFSWLFKLAFNP